jgi:hypothetical protein
MGRNVLECARVGDANAVLAAVGNNFQGLVARLATICRALIATTLAEPTRPRSFDPEPTLA